MYTARAISGTKVEVVGTSVWSDEELVADVVRHGWEDDVAGLRRGVVLISRDEDGAILYTVAWGPSGELIVTDLGNATVTVHCRPADYDGPDDDDPTGVDGSADGTPEPGERAAWRVGGGLAYGLVLASYGGHPRRMQVLEDGAEYPVPVLRADVFPLATA